MSIFPYILARWYKHTCSKLEKQTLVSVVIRGTGCRFYISSVTPTVIEAMYVGSLLCGSVSATFGMNPSTGTFECVLFKENEFLITCAVKFILGAADINNP